MYPAGNSACANLSLYKGRSTANRTLRTQERSRPNCVCPKAQQQRAELTRRQFNASAACFTLAALDGNIPTDTHGYIPTIDIGPNLRISRVVRGCWQLSGAHKGQPSSDRTSGDPALDDCAAFLRAGITTFDTADTYGPSERLIGAFLTVDPDARQQMEAVMRSRGHLGVSRIGMVQLFWGDYSIKHYVDAALYLTELKTEGLISEVGMTNVDTDRLEELVEAGVPVATNQVQFSLLDTRPLARMLPYCTSSGVALMAHGVLAGGFLAEQYLGVPASRVVVDTASKAKYARIIRQRGGWPWLQDVLKVLHVIARRHGTSLSNVACRWVLEQQGVTAIVVGARNTQHIQDHQALFALALDDVDHAQIRAVLDSGRPPSSDCYAWERGGSW